jgi:hypothetical protein
MGLEPQSSPTPWDEYMQRLAGRVTPNALQTWIEPMRADLEG